jgi:hypothetical protein
MNLRENHKPEDLPFVYAMNCPRCKKRCENEFGFRYCLFCGAPMKPPKKSAKIGRSKETTDEPA